MASNKSIEFVYAFLNGSQQCTLKAPLSIPLDHPVCELTLRLIKAHNLPCHIQADLESCLRKFVERELVNLQDAAANKAITKVSNQELDKRRLLADWTSTFTREVLLYAKVEPVSNELVFSEVYHSLIHSHYLEALLNLEHMYSLAIGELLGKRDSKLSQIDARQRSEMEEAVKQVGVGFSDEQINQLAQRHFEHVEMVESKWASELSNLQETQRRDFRNWVMKLYESSQLTGTALSHSASAVEFPPEVTAVSSRRVESAIYERREESFTVHLGAQLKTSHNLRLISADVLDLCKHRQQSAGGIAAQCLQTAISLYSNSLCGLVLLVDNRLNSYTGIKRDFAKVCQQSTEFHMPSLEQQFERMDQSIADAAGWRAKKKASSSEEADRMSIKSSGSSISFDHDSKPCTLQTGDCYITRHSNLSEVHTVFHLVSDDSVRSSVSEISSRHPIIMGYRNILKCCFRYDIRTISLPLLLVHEMTEEMTIPWCMKRAELMFKCVKGFIMELAMWSGQDSCTIQFLVPKMLSDEMFTALSNMMPSIFRMSNPVIAKS